MADGNQNKVVKQRWIPLEANPDVLNKYAGKLGLDTTRLSFTDVWGLDEVHLLNMSFGFLIWAAGWCLAL